MTTRHLILLGLALTPALIECTEITDRHLIEGQSGSAGSGDTSAQAGSDSTAGGTITAPGGAGDGGDPFGGSVNGGSEAQAGMGGSSTGGTPLTGGTGGTGGGSAGKAGSGGTAGTGGKGGSGGATAGGGSGGTTGGGGSAGSAGSGGEVACPAGVVGHCSAGVTYAPQAGFTLALVEDFPAPLDLDTDPVFTWSDGSPADGQTGFRKQQITFANDTMIITAEQPSGCTATTSNPGCIAPRASASYAEALSPNAVASIGAMGVWSGELRSKYNNYRYGYYEVKYQAPVANPGQEGTDTMAGDFLATMFVFRSPKNVFWNEIDIELEANHHNMVAGNAVNAQGAVGYPGGNADAWTAPGPTGYNITQPHVYAFSWTPTKIEWFCDGVSIQTFTGSAADPIPTLSAKIMMNLWVFSGTAFGDGKNNKYPLHATYDYFHFYKWGQETTYPCDPLPGCLAPADKTKSAQNNLNEVNYGSGGSAGSGTSGTGGTQ